MGCCFSLYKLFLASCPFVSDSNRNETSPLLTEEDHHQTQFTQTDPVVVVTPEQPQKSRTMPRLGQDDFKQPQVTIGTSNYRFKPSQQKTPKLQEAAGNIKIP